MSNSHLGTSACIFSTTFEYFANISETVRDRAISTEFLTHRVVEKYSIQNFKKFQFSPLLAAILNFCEKQKNLNISETVRDRAIWTEFLTRRVVGKYSIQN